MVTVSLQDWFENFDSKNKIDNWNIFPKKFFEIKQKPMESFILLLSCIYSPKCKYFMLKVWLEDSSLRRYLT